MVITDINVKITQEIGAIILEMTPMLKTVSNLPLGFPEYGMTKANNFRWGQQPLKGEEGIFLKDWPQV